MSDGSRISQTGDAARGITIFVQLRSDGPNFFQTQMLFLIDKIFRDMSTL